jgi:hypothetical protein
MGNETTLSNTYSYAYVWYNVVNTPDPEPSPGNETVPFLRLSRREVSRLENGTGNETTFSNTDSYAYVWYNVVNT